MEILNLSCCGVKEIRGLSYSGSASEAFREFGKLTFQRTQLDLQGNPQPAPIDKFRYVLFSQAGKPEYEYGTAFAEFLREHNLGTILETSFNLNPNSGNQLKVWLWTVDWGAVKAWFATHAEKKVA